MRSYKPIVVQDLKELQRLSENERSEFFKRNPKYVPFKKLHLATCLCQGAALHYLDKKTGVKDFDIWFFYREHPSLTYPYRAIFSVDSVLNKFGKGRRVDLMGRTIADDIVKRNKGNPTLSIREYLTDQRTESSRKLSEKAVIGLYPQLIFGEKIWPV